jgi:hypothetical protein
VLFVVDVSGEPTHFMTSVTQLCFYFLFFILFHQWLNILSRLVGCPVSVIWHTRWMNHSLGRRVVMSLPTPYMLLYTRSKATVTSRVGRAQSTATAKVPTTSLPNTTSKQQEIFTLNKDLIFIGPRASHVDYRLAVMYAYLKEGHIQCARRLYRWLTRNHPDQKERLADVNIYNAFIEAYMKRDGLYIGFMK